VNYVLDLFTPETWKAFREHGADVTGFSVAHRSRARNLVRPGDLFVCYLVRLSRWCGLLEVESEVYEDSTPIFQPENDPWIIRFKVKPIVLLDEHFALPIRLPEIWEGFSRTHGLAQNSPAWPAKAVLQSSLVKLRPEDGLFLSTKLREQNASRVQHPLSEHDERLLKKSFETVKSTGGLVTVVVPESAEAESRDDVEIGVLEDSRDSIKKQALLVGIGAKMGFDIWLPRSDRSRVERELSSEAREKILDQLPVNYDRVTFKTIENIDVLWLKKKRLVRAFEVEHTTAVYSGLLRMADLLALQPNIDIKLHIVAPGHRRDKVLDEIQRPVFALLDKGPLASSCSFLSYEALEELAQEEHLAHMNDSVLEEYEEVASDLERN
jgi:hypothetical protein